MTVKEEMRESEGEEIEEEMQNEIRKWFFAERDDQGKFPEYPSDDEGGSAAIFHPERFMASGGSAAAVAGAAGEDAAAEQAMRKAIVDGGGEESKKKGAKGNSDSAAATAAAAAAEGLEGEHDEAGFILRATEHVRQLRLGQKLFDGTIISNILPEVKPTGLWPVMFSVRVCV